MKFAFKALLYILSIVFIILGLTGIFNITAMIVLGVIIFGTVTFWAMYDIENNEAEIFLLKQRIEELEKVLLDKEDK